MDRGRFIAIEGVEGGGKSTHLHCVGQLVAEAGHEVVLTREPGGVVIGERIREILLNPAFSDMTPMTELLLLFAARAQHVAEVIRPALERGAWVVSDRFTDSSLAYQGGGRRLGAAVVGALEKLALDGLRPDHVLILDLDVGMGLARSSGVADADRFETEQQDFFARARAVFLERAGQPGYHVIDASQPIAQVQDRIRNIIRGVLEP